ncbi:MAG TPA: deoxyribonuclease IV [Sphaerochaeta sp.]|jgi:deoxyribonuclease-4|nr:deoxyribonuclease IV [Spirochaetales bacterium]HQB54068.1 deoxyribonuclease IV [Sphaerochaeta sp.]
MYYIGAHTSIAGGLENALLEAQRLNATGLGMFTKNQRRWDAKPIEADEADRFTKVLQETGFKPDRILIHGSYLINLGNPDREKQRRSIGAIADELRRAERLGLKLVNTHPGSTLGLVSKEEGMKIVGRGIDEALDRSESAVLVIENTSGSGSNLGSTIEELAGIFEATRNHARLGFCLDTCHAHVAGYDLATIEGFEAVIARFDRLIGLEYLRGLHLNDALSESGSRRDRHASLGEGTIGWPTFEYIVQDCRFKRIPLVLETPDPSIWADEIAHLHALTFKNRTCEVYWPKRRDECSI